MDIVDRSLPRYLRAVRGVPRPEAPRPESAPFLTLSRQPGAGARTLAEAFVRAMAEQGEGGWRVFDDAAFRRVVLEAKLQSSVSLAQDELYAGGLTDFLLQLFGIASPQDALMHAAFRAMRVMAQEGRVVFVGRGAVCVTRDLGGVHARLVASEPRRVRRLMERYRVPAAEAVRLARELERSRRRYFRSHFHRDIDDPLLYDLIINTDAMAPDEAARMLIGAVRERPRRLVEA